ncbi:ADAM 17-like protease isoform X2 [Sitophilus oryzae]|uniref:ADAM 17-like protease isoform X2 n=1 Tax=Sitophilus oryzae TaxID=7048 RepID=A0A6J2X375_SITOR|nr:ADAM 17-like protease isoform X2 [Sitophilus oryzae]
MKNFQITIIILVSYVVLDLLFNSAKVISLTILEELPEYHLTSDEQFSYENKIIDRKNEANPFSYVFKIIYRNNISNAYIRKRKSDIILKGKSTLTVIYGDGKNYSEDFDKYVELYEGYMENRPEDSSISGYIKDNYFYGRVIIAKEVYYIDQTESTTHRFRRESSGILIDKSEDLGKIFHDKNNSHYNPELVAHIKQAFRKRMQALTVKPDKSTLEEFHKWKQQGMLCPLLLVMDNSFLRILHGGNKQSAISHVLFTLEESNVIFRTTDFDMKGGADNIGFYIKKLEIVETIKPPYYLEKYSGTIPADSISALTTFTMYQELGNYCLGGLLTAQVFDESVLGLAFVGADDNNYGLGGICESTFYDTTFNTFLATAYLYEGRTLNQMQFEATIAHEIGHTFGSLHDSEDGRLDCFGHIMSPVVFDRYTNKKQVSFSSCSKRRMIDVMVMKAKCFEPVEASFCGNTILEKDEDCDCGLMMECSKKDPCCVPRRTSEQPCKYCNNFDMTCPCTGKYEGKSCPCGVRGRCLNDVCHSYECDRLGLTECDCAPVKLKSCEHCCQLDDKCVTAFRATQILIKEKQDKRVFERIRNMTSRTDKKHDIKGRIHERFCIGDEKIKKNCLHLQFFKATAGQYCSTRGSLGKCINNKETFVCKILEKKPKTHTFPFATGSCGTCFKIFSIFQIPAVKYIVFIFYCLILKEIT